MFMNKKLKAFCERLPVLWKKIKAWRFKDWYAARKEKQFLAYLATEIDPYDYNEETISPIAECEVSNDADKLTDFARRHIKDIETATYVPGFGPPIEFHKKTVYEDGSVDETVIASRQEVERSARAAGIQTPGRIEHRDGQITIS